MSIADISEDFESGVYGVIRIDLKTNILTVLDIKHEVPEPTARIISAFIDSANRGEKGLSKKTLAELTGYKANSLAPVLQKFRDSLSGLMIADGVDANSLFLSEKMLGPLTQEEKTQGLEKRPYHFNNDLADSIEEHGYNIPVSERSDIRFEPVRTLNRTANPEIYAAHIS